MKTFWKKYRLRLCLLLAVLCGVTILTGLNALRLDPSSKSIVIDDPTALLYGVGEQSYIVTSGKTNIMVLNEKGQYIRTIAGGKEAQSFYYAQTLAVDEDGNLYVDKTRFVYDLVRQKGNDYFFISPIHCF